MCWRIAKGKNRRGWSAKLLGSIPQPPNDETHVWVHAVSVGEVNLLQPVLDRLHQLHPEMRIAISATTETGFDLAARKYPEYLVFFCPFDFSWAINRVLKRLHAEAIVLAELELWPNLLLVAGHREIPVIVVNGRMSERSFTGYQRFGFLTRPLMRNLSLVLAQNETYATRFRELGCSADRVEVTGSVKFDGAPTDPNNPLTQGLVAATRWAEDAFVWVAGSTQLEEDVMVGQVWNELNEKHRQLRLILVPRHPERCQALKQELVAIGVNVVFRSELSESGVPAGSVLVVDVIGELGGWWGRADVGYVGGSMGKREGQNMIEPAAYGVPVCFGPRTKNFKDVVMQLLTAKAARVVENQSQLQAFIEFAIEHSSEAQQMGQRAQQVVAANRGATDRSVSRMLAELNR